ncbi:MAG: hypothetical protein ACYDA9_03095 [Terriglobia bacterium]
MPPDHAISFGGGATETTLNPFVLVAMALAIILVLVLPRKYAVLPLLLITFLVPLKQTVVVGGIHLFVSRIIILAGLVRLVGAKLASQDGVLTSGYNSIDNAFFWCMVSQSFAVMLLFRDTGALIYEGGFLLDNLGAYFIMRFFIRDEEGVYRALKCLALISLVLAVAMVIEQVKQVNVFSYIGGGAAVEIRDGKIRSQGVFLQTLLAGVFGATLLPLFLLLWKNGKARLLGAIGIISATVMTITSNSSTPLLAYAAGVFAVCLWPIRKKMRSVRWGLVAGLAGLTLVMKAPVWFVIAHVDLTGSSSGYQRAEIVDQFIRHFSDWWLIGVKDTSSWGWDLWDTQNQYVNVGETGGIAALIVFILLISRAFGRIGDARKAVEADPQRQWPLWFLGAALFAHITAFFGVNYFDQSRVNWFVLLAMISTITAPILAETKKPAKAELVYSPFGYPQEEPVNSFDSPPR